MKVLVTGAAGFIGRHVVAALVSAGHEVSRGLRGGSAAAGPADVLCDFDLDVQPESWLPRLAGVDAVINCAGILREGRGARFESVHVAAPHALFRACEHLGIRRVIQVSALGDPADGEFIASKHRGDALLASTALDWVVLRPSVVYSTQGSYGGTSLLRAMAVTPFVLALPGDGRQRLQPIDADDLAAMIVALLAPGATSKTVIEVVGPEMLTLEDYLRQWRTWLKAPSPQVVLHVPGWLVGAVAAIGERLGSGPLGRTMNSMLARGNVGAPGSLARMQSILGRMPRTLRMALAERPSFVQDRWQARLHLLEPMLRIALVFVWIFSARVGFSTPAAEIDAMLRPVGLGPEVSIPLVRAASAIDLLLGLLLLARWRPRLVGALMIASLAGYTAFIGTMLPGAWLDPFGGLLKNVALLPAVAVMMAMAERR